MKIIKNNKKNTTNITKIIITIITTIIAITKIIGIHIIKIINPTIHNKISRINDNNNFDFCNKDISHESILYFSTKYEVHGNNIV